MNNITLNVNPSEISKVITILQNEGLSTDFVGCPDGSATFALELTDEALESLNTAILRYRLKSGIVALVKSSVIAASSVVNVLAYEGAKTAKNISESAEYQQARGSICGLGKKVSTLLGWKSGIKITKS